jgi:hypothetical protein
MKLRGAILGTAVVTVALACACGSGGSSSAGGGDGGGKAQGDAGTRRGTDSGTDSGTGTETGTDSGSGADGGSSVPGIVLAHPVLQSMLEALGGENEGRAGSATSFLYAGEVSDLSGDPLCTGTCQTYGNIILDDCNGTTVTTVANSKGYESAFTHTSTPPASSNRFQRGGESTNCASVLGGTWTNALLPLINYSDANAQSVLSGTVITASTVPQRGVFLDDHMFDYAAPLGSYEICDGCGHTWLRGGSDNLSYLGNVADELNTLPDFRVWLNSLGVGAGTTLACATVEDNHCTGDGYNLGTYDSRVRVDELCSGLKQPNLSVIRQENAFTDGSYGGTPDADLGRTVAVLLDTIYALQNGGANCLATKLVPQQSGASSANAWLAPALWAVAAMAPSSDGTPDQLVPETYENCGTDACTPFWPEQLIVPYGPSFKTSPYTFCTGSCTVAHDSTWAGPGCTATGGPAPFDQESGGIHDLVAGCAASSFPVLAAPYEHCYFLTYDLGACKWVLNTDPDTDVSYSSAGYAYAVSFGGQYFGKGSGTPSTLFPWLSPSLAAYANLATEQSICTDTSGCAGTISFGSPPTTLAAAGNVGSAVLLTRRKPPGY